MNGDVRQFPHRTVPSTPLTVRAAYIARLHLQAFAIRCSRVDAETLQNAAATTELDTQLLGPLSVLLKSMDTGNHVST